MSTQVKAPPRVTSKFPTMVDRRGTRRVSSGRACTCNVITVRQRPPFWSGKIRDVSPRGISLLLTRYLEPGTFLAIHLDDGICQPLRAKVVHASIRANELGYVIGCILTRPLSSAEVKALT